MFNIPGFGSCGPRGRRPGGGGAFDSCPVCVWRQHSRELRLESIKSQILSKLRLKEAPNISREVVKQLLPKAPPLQQILDLHDFQGDALQPEDFLEEDEYHATTGTVISMAQETDPAVQTDGSPLCCHFHFSPKVMFTKSIDFKQVLHSWFRQPQSNWGIEINAFYPSGTDLAVTFLGPGAEGLHPFMELQVLENTKRSRRNLGLDCDTPVSPAAADILSRWTLRLLAGTGSLHLSATRPTTAPASENTSSCRSIHTSTWCNRPTQEALLGPAAPLPRCPQSTCSTSMTSSRLSTARSLAWWWIDVAAPKVWATVDASPRPYPKNPSPGPHSLSPRVPPHLFP